MKIFKCIKIVYPYIHNYHFQHPLVFNFAIHELITPLLITKFQKNFKLFFLFQQILNYERDTIMAALRTVPSGEGTGKGEKSMAKKLELKFLTSANTERYCEHCRSEGRARIVRRAGGGRKNHAGAGKRQGHRGGFFR